MIMSYRPDIDGLRAISILFVIIFHAFPYILQGGFIGVDIFFVISGYLITSILLKQIDDNKFSPLNFYARRIKRLYPSLLVVLAVTLSYGCLVLFPEEFKQLAKHALASSVYINNFVLYKETCYFDAASDYKPLLHLWSLSIEEQFYLIWPFLLYFARRRKLSIGSLLLTCILSSFALNIYFVYRKHSYAFYMPFTRFWELLIGAALAYITLYKQLTIHRALNFISKNIHINEKTLKHLASIIGLLLIISGALLTTESKLFPGWWALFPTIGAFLIIFSGETAWVNSKILSNKLMTAIGHISYPLYLWHWPLLSFSRIIKGEISTKLTLLLLILCTCLSYLTYRCLETPFRKKTNFAAIPLLSAMTPVIIIGICVKIDLISSVISSDPNTLKVTKAIQEWDYPKGLIAQKINDKKIYSIGEHSRKILFFGDSNIEQYAPRIKKLVQENQTVKRSAVFLTGGGCPPIPNVYEDKHPYLVGFAETALEYTKNPDVDVIVIGAAWIGYLSGSSSYYHQNNGINNGSLKKGSIALKSAYQDLFKMLKQWTDSGKKVYLVLSMPINSKCDPKALLQRTFFSSPKTQLICFNANEWQQASDAVHTELRRIASIANVTVIDPTTSFCNSTECLVVTPAGDPLYKDAGHLRPTFVAEHVTYLDTTLFE